jgi:chromosome segregation ATPase
MRQLAVILVVAVVSGCEPPERPAADQGKGAGEKKPAAPPERGMSQLAARVDRLEAMVEAIGDRARRPVTESKKMSDQLESLDRRLTTLEERFRRMSDARENSSGDMERSLSMVRGLERRVGELEERGRRGSSGFDDSARSVERIEARLQNLDGWLRDLHAVKSDVNSLVMRMRDVDYRLDTLERGR